MKRSDAKRCEPAFTLVELMVSMALISMMTVLLVTMTNSTAKLWTYTTSRSEQFRSASTAFEAITRRLSQATLNTYWDYDDPAKPTRYQRQSDLRFIAGNMQTLTGGATKPVRPTHGLFFQAPLGFVDLVVGHDTKSLLLARRGRNTGDRIA